MPKKKVLCLAEGEGRNAVFLARQGYHVSAVDLSEVGLQKLAATQVCQLSASTPTWLRSILVKAVRMESYLFSAI
jgi:hypothetical protein